MEDNRFEIKSSHPKAHLPIFSYSDFIAQVERKENSVKSWKLRWVTDYDLLQSCNVLKYLDAVWNCDILQNAKCKMWCHAKWWYVAKLWCHAKWWNVAKLWCHAKWWNDAKLWCHAKPWVNHVLGSNNFETKMFGG